MADFLAAIENKQQRSPLFRERRETVQASGAPTSKEKDKKRRAPARPLQRSTTPTKDKIGEAGESPERGGNQRWEF